MSQEYSFGYWLRLRRKALDLTRQALADLVGCSAATIRKLEAEERRPSLQIAERLAMVLDIPSEERAAFLQFARGNFPTLVHKPTEYKPWKESKPEARVNIPAGLTSLIGREREIALVEAYLKSDERRLVSLVGPPGIGKTRLSLEIARTISPHFPDGAYFVELAPLDDGCLIYEAILQGLGYKGMKSQPDPNDLMGRIGERQLLLILDNCEHLIEAVASLGSDLLKACPNLKIMATSREALRIPGEWVYIVPALELPKGISSFDFEKAASSSAIALFAERARAARPDFSLNADNILPVAAICEQLDGLPLAIELIAARVRLMSPQALLERLTESFVLSADGRRAVSPRQKTLGEAIGWSFDLLSPAEQRLFASLGVFSGGFTLGAAETIFTQILPSSTRGNLNVVDLILSLSDKSLLQRVYDDQSEVRFRMLVTIRKYALNRLHDSGFEEQARNGHLAYFLDFAERGDRELRGPQQMKWGRQLEIEQDNFRAALDWSISCQRTETSLRLLGALGWAWELQGRYIEAHNWYEKVKTLPGVADHPLLYARLLNHIGRQCWTQEKYQEGLRILEESRAIVLAKGSEDEAILAETLNWLGMAVLFGNHGHDQASVLLNEGLEISRRLGDRYGEALSMFHLGILASDMGQVLTAISNYQQSRAIFKDLGDLFFIARVDLFLGNEYLKTRNAEKAEFHFEEHLRIDLELQFWDGLADAWRNLGYLRLYQGEYDQAEDFFEKSLKLSLEHGLHVSRTLFGLGIVALYRSDYVCAYAHFSRLLGLAHKSENMAWMANSITGLVIAAVGNNQPKRAVILNAVAQEISGDKGDAWVSDAFNDFAGFFTSAREKFSGEELRNLEMVGRSMTLEQAMAYAQGEDPD